jgi:dehydrogenase/reductase SDR family protein 1
MVPRKQGLIVNISSPGGQSYLFNVAYGVGKAALDRMSVDCGLELKKHNVACLSLMLGAAKTEKMVNLVSGSNGEKLKLKSDPSNKQDTSFKKMVEEGESVEFGGKIIAHMSQNPKIMKYTKKIVSGSDYAQTYDIKDIDGKVHVSYRSLKSLGPYILPKNLHYLTNYAPNFKIPQFLIDVANSKVHR